MAHVYLSIGSNLDDPVMQVRRAIETLRGVGIVSAVSPFYRTKPWGTIRSQPDFVNVVVALETALSPRDLLEAVKAAERKFGRDNQGERYGPRVIDFDILTYDDLAVDEPDLKIPHPRMNERAFVLVPLAELDSRYEAARDALAESELEDVRRF